MAKKKLDTSGMIGTAASVIEQPQEAATPRQKGVLAPEKRRRASTEQFNIRVSEGLGDEIKMWALAHKVTPADVLEQGFELMKSKFGA